MAKILGRKVSHVIADEPFLENMDETKAEKIIDTIWEAWEERLHDWNLERGVNHDAARVLAIEALKESKIR